MNPLVKLENLGIEIYLDKAGGLCLSGLGGLTDVNWHRTVEFARQNKGLIIAELEARAARIGGQVGPTGRDISDNVCETRRNAFHEAVSAGREAIEDNTLVRSRAIQAAETAFPARQEINDYLPGAENMDNASAGKPRRCRTCWKWENIRGRCWWMGRCTVDGREVASNSVCRLGVTHDDSWRLFLPALLPPCRPAEENVSPLGIHPDDCVFGGRLGTCRQR
ncbi:MAG: hypothetical protein LBC14_07765 [Desulfovibrio sp.]|jgi:hypothetical protein|nr:hypothetical protein [Desulfovibrio sp.]